MLTRHFATSVSYRINEDGEKETMETGGKSSYTPSEIYVVETVAPFFDKKIFSTREAAEEYKRRCELWEMYPFLYPLVPNDEGEFVHKKDPPKSWTHYENIDVSVNFHLEGK